MQYVIRVAGVWDDAAADMLAGLEAHVEAEEILLSGDLDQAALNGFLERIRVLGLDLIEVRPRRTVHP
jgi:hypothetical protein